MKRRTACIGCDLLIELPSIAPSRSKLCCPRCNHTLTRGHKNALDYTLAIAITCLFLLFISLSFNFLSFEASGQFREIMLFETTRILYVQEFYFLAILVCFLTIIFPFIYLMLLLDVLLPIKLALIFNRLRPKPTKKSAYTIRFINKLTPWLMVDVFFIGILVALIKMWSLASLSFGASFWAYLIFVLLFSYILYCVDQQKLYKWIMDEN